MENGAGALAPGLEVEKSGEPTHLFSVTCAAASLTEGGNPYPGELDATPSLVAAKDWLQGFEPFCTQHHGFVRSMHHD